MAQIDLQGALRLLERAQTAVIVTHPNPDGDAIGSTLALMHLLRALGRPEPLCVCDDPVPEVYAWLPGADRMRTTATLSPTPCSLAIVLDVAASDRLGDAKALVEAAETTLVLDHHAETEPFGDHTCCSPTYCAVGEMIAELFELAGEPMSPDAAACTYVSIATDTGGFRYGNTTANAHRVAATLLETGIDVASISSRVFEETPRPKFELMRRAIERVEIMAGGRLAHTAITRSDMEAAGAQLQHLDGLVNYARNIKGVEVAVFFYAKEEAITKVSLRSNASTSGDAQALRQPFNCAQFLKQFGGGGHAGAAGATLEAPLDQAREQILGSAAAWMESHS